MIKLPEVKVRNIGVDDIKPVYKLGLAIFDWPTERALWTEDIVRWYSYHAKPSCFVAVRYDVVIGFVLCYANQSIGRIEWVAVDVGYHKSGIASELIRRALLVFRMNRITQISALAREDGKANNLFIHMGFKEIGLKKTEMVLNSQESCIPKSSEKNENSIQ